MRQRVTVRLLSAPDVTACIQPWTYIIYMHSPCRIACTFQSALLDCRSHSHSAHAVIFSRMSGRSTFSSCVVLDKCFTHEIFIIDHFYIALFCALEQTHSARM